MWLHVLLGGSLCAVIFMQPYISVIDQHVEVVAVRVAHALPSLTRCTNEVVCAAALFGGDRAHCITLHARRRPRSGVFGIDGVADGTAPSGACHAKGKEVSKDRGGAQGFAGGAGQTRHARCRIGRR